MPLIQTRTLAVIAGILGTLAWPSLIALTYASKGLDLSWNFTVMCAIAPVTVLVGMFARGSPAGPLIVFASDILGSLLNGVFWAVLLGGANWGRANSRPLMWTILTTIAAYWTIVVAVALLLRRL